MIRDLKPVWSRSSDAELSETSANLVAVLRLVVMAALAGGAALRESVTIDEVAHIGAGVSYLQKLDLRMNAEHPPLPKVLAALPLALRGVHADYNHPSWSFTEKFFPAYLGILYFALVFGAGFVLGTIRTLWVVLRRHENCRTYGGAHPARSHHCSGSVDSSAPFAADGLACPT